MSAWPGDGLSRRRFLHTAGLAGIGAVAASALGWTAGRAWAGGTIAGQPTGDVTVLGAAIELEYQALFTYDAVIKSNVLVTPALSDLVRAVLNDHGAHLDQMGATVRALGGEPALPKDSYPLPPDLKDETAVATAAWKLEEVFVQGYLAAMPRLIATDPRQVLASILGVEAQHAAVLRTALHLDPAPKPFLTDGLS